MGSIASRLVIYMGEKMGKSYEFYIQTNNPYIMNEFSRQDNKLSQAIESIFPMNTEALILFWNHIGVPLSYKYEISYMVDDILMFLKRIQSEEKGEVLVHWLPDTFRADWRLIWNNEIITIEADWENITGDLQRILVDLRKINMSKKEFVSEWKMPLEVLINALDRNGYNQLLKDEYDNLVNIFNHIDEYGILYQNKNVC